ncbi:hypothetical protein IIA29_12115 [candidate division KSB1 bacterium]|nr:hypothetical protein [candidate division KSB1 bacterium]
MFAASNDGISITFIEDLFQLSEYTMMDAATYSDDFLVQRYSIGYVPNAPFLVDADFGAASKTCWFSPTRSMKHR